MRIVLAAVGRARGDPAAALAEDYLVRAGKLSRPLGFYGPDLVEIDAPKKGDATARKSMEGEKLLAAVADGAALIGLDERGDNLSSEEIARLLAGLRDEGSRAAAFVIGGADGLSEQFRARGRRLIAFGAATWPHMLVRAMAAEQIYRSMTILAGHPYHRA